MTDLIFRGALTEASLATLLTVAPDDFDTCNRLSRRLQNYLIPRRRHLLQISPAQLLAALAEVPDSQEQEIHRLLKMFLAMYLIFAEGQEILADTKVNPERLAKRRGAWRGLLQRRKIGGDAPAVARYFLEEETRKGETPHLAMLRGCLAYKSDRLDEAFKAFDRARQLFDSGARAYHHYRGVCSLRPLPVFRKVLAQGAETSRDFMIEEAGSFPEDLPILVIGVDQGYYDLYAERWLEGTAGRVNLHFHVANPELARLHRAAHIRYSFETCPDAAPAYFASMRFLHLHHLLDHYQKPLIVSDADAHLVGDPDHLLQEMMGYDLAITVSGPFRDHMPWRHLLAGVVAVRPGSQSEAFLAAFRKLYSYLEADGGTQWWVDQALLSSSRILLNEQKNAPQILCEKLWKSSGLKQGKL
jgi:hypothetical protein